jgi:hypothetical protein
MTSPRRAAPDLAVDRDLLSAAGGGLAAELQRFAAEARVAEATAARSRERWLRQQAEEEATAAGVLCDLAERRLPVTVDTLGGGRHRGMVAAVARDFVVMALDSGLEVMVALDGLAAIRPEPGARSPVGDRQVDVELTLVDALSHLAGDRPRVRVVTRSGDHLAGTLRAVGQDVVTIELDGDARAVVFVPIGAVMEAGPV